MLRVALKNLVLHKIRTIALVLTVVLGVSFVAGTYVLTDTITKVFDDIFADVYEGTDVSVRHESELGMDAARTPVPATLLADVQRVDGVRAAEGNVFVLGVDIIDADGDRVGNPQAPSFGTTWGEDEELSPFTLREGRKPAGPGEVALDARSFADGDFSLGDEVMIVTPLGPVQMTIVGVAGFGDASNIAGATLTIFELATAQEMLGREGQFDSIAVAAEPGVSADVLQERIAATLPAGYEAVTSTELTEESSDAIASALGFFKTFMLVFAFVALFVGAFIVYNTYSVVVATRTRELALVRALGASGAVVLGSVVLEAVVTGVIASGIGLAAGLGIAAGLRRLLDAFGFGMPSGGLVLLGRTVWVAMIGGPLITVIASLVPAVRAARVSPLAAMRESALAPKRAPVRAVSGALLTAAGIAAVLLGLDRGELAVLGIGAVTLFVGVAMFAATIGKPVVAVLGEPIEHTCGVPGLLAHENAARNPKRTATTASALMVGTALMAASFVLSSSITESVDRAVSNGALGDLVVVGPGETGFSPALADEIEVMPDVAAVTRYRFAAFKLGDATKQLVGLPAAALVPGSPEQSLDIDLASGDLARLPDGGIAVQSEVAADHDWVLGDTVTITVPNGTRELELVATYERNALVGDYVIDQSTFEAGYDVTTDYLVMMLLRPGADLSAVQREITSLVDARYPGGIEVQTREQYLADVKEQVAQFTNLVTALLVLAVGIALLGVLITMLLSVSERTRELGLLRAVGMSRRQTRSVVRWEAVIVSTYGALLGLAVGVFLGSALVSALHHQGITVTVVPFRPLLLLAAVIALLGVAASVYPARRAARLNVVAAVSTL
jgi:putative ABC transport system permease protein